MVVGLRTKSRRGPTVHVDYLIHIQEIKPWPPTQALKTLRSVLIQWENGDRSSGTTNSVVPSLGSGVGEGKIEFNESFKLPVTLSIKGGGDSDTFQKNCLEFNLYEPRRDKTVKGQLLGTAIIDLADYGVIKETLSINAAVNCQRNFRNTAQPILYVEIERLSKGRRTSSSSRDNLVKEVLLDQNGGKSDSALINREYAEEAELASITDDDVSSHSSLNVSSSAYVSNGGSPPQNEENNSETVKDDTVGDIKDLSSGPGSPVNGHDSLSNFSESNIMSIPEEIVAPRVQSYSSYTTDVDTEEECKSTTRSNGHVDLDQEVHEKVAYGRNKFGTSAQPSIEENTLNAAFIKVSLPNDDSEAVQKLASTSVVHSQVDGENDEKACRFGRNGLDETAKAVDIDHGSLEDKKGDKEQENGQKNHIMDEDNQTLKDTLISRFQRDTTTKKVSTGSDTLSYSTVNLGMKNHILTSDRLKHVKSVRSPSDSGKSNGLVRGNQSLEEVKEAGVVRDALDGSRFLSSERKDSRVHPIETMNAYPDSKIQQLEHRIKILEGELREAAAVEVALYSIVAEHGSSMSKVHAPARRLSRLYLHACKEKSLSRRANAARAAVSGLFLVAKACGNDVPRLTFWLSNSVLMRIIISQAIGDSDLPLFARPFIERTGNGKVNRNRSSPLKWESSSSMKERINGLSVDDWEDPNTFTSALEKIEAWIFSRIIESVWWQTLTPHMQSTAAKAIEGGVGSNSSKCYRRVSSSGDQEKANLSLDLWKKAFQDARERLCPVRAGGHECGCLPVLTKLIMEQCVARLDVAMFNAILRESADEIPTDPVSDPISDPKVLPIPAGEFSFGAGAQLKNAIGNWSRLLSDLFGMDDDVSLGDENDQNHDDEGQDTSFKSFHILNALSDLMMLPKDMLLSRSIRKEVCPTFGASLIKRIINSFVPDEFCPDPIPEVVLEALDSEDTLESEVEFVTNFPCTAAPTVYSPPATASIAHIIGEISCPQLKRSPSSVLRKSYTSDDELDELDCPLTCIFMDSLRDSPKPAKSNCASKQNGSQNSVRYQLLREVWMDSV